MGSTAHGEKIALRALLHRRAPAPGPVVGHLGTTPTNPAPSLFHPHSVPPHATAPRHGSGAGRRAGAAGARGMCRVARCRVLAPAPVRQSLPPGTRVQPQHTPRTAHRARLGIRAEVPGARPAHDKHTANRASRDRGAPGKQAQPVHSSDTAWPSTPPPCQSGLREAPRKLQIRRHPPMALLDWTAAVRNQPERGLGDVAVGRLQTAPRGATAPRAQRDR